MTTSQKLIAGCVSGATTRFITQPFDVIKIRTQLSKRSSENKHKTLYEITRKIFKEEGVTAFWQGHNLGQIHSIVAISSQFYFYEISTKYVNSYNKPILFVCGVFAGCCSATLTVPIEVIRTRQMLVKDQYKGLIKGVTSVYKSGGLYAFYEGWIASMLQLGPAIGISFSVFRFVQPLVLDYLRDCKGDCKHTEGNVHRPEDLLLATPIAGAVAGFISKVATYPLELTKRRLQIASHKSDDKYNVPSTSRNLIKCTKLVDCITKTLKKEGVFGLFVGLKVTIFKAQVQSIVAFTTYELVCHFIREHNVMS